MHRGQTALAKEFLALWQRQTVAAALRIDIRTAIFQVF